MKIVSFVAREQVARLGFRVGSLVARVSQLTASFTAATVAFTTAKEASIVVAIGALPCWRVVVERMRCLWGLVP